MSMPRRNRLSRSRDFDAVYRNGRSVSTRFLVLYWFPRAVGPAVTRNKVKRRLRELWRARLDAIPRGRDYVLVARPGLPETLEARGFDWLGERVDEVLQKAAA